MVEAWWKLAGVEMQVFITITTGQTDTVWVTGKITVDRLKSMLSTYCGVPSCPIGSYPRGRERAGAAQCSEAHAGAQCCRGWRALRCGQCQRHALSNKAPSMPPSGNCVERAGRFWHNWHYLDYHDIWAWDWPPCQFTNSLIDWPPGECKISLHVYN